MICFSRPGRRQEQRNAEAAEDEMKALREELASLFPEKLHQFASPYLPSGIVCTLYSKDAEEAYARLVDSLITAELNAIRHLKAMRWMP
ncbi:hypothetical protein PANTOEA_08350 [Pantoea dispersa]|uniref:hypothetical protein n=1 Tax=Pantoea dispersa TaxID=59814 RepID=UPI001CA634BA|nr:hypothetical protein [Pantoea dispersa]QZY95972.1 hypothetical protein K7X52_05910 [Pantoea dispersa]